MAVKPAHLGKAGKRVLNDKFFKKAKVYNPIAWHRKVASELAHTCSARKFLCVLQSEGYLARSAFKLQELQQKHKLITPGLKSFHCLYCFIDCLAPPVATRSVQIQVPGC